MRFGRRHANRASAPPLETCRAKTLADGTPGLSVQEHCRIVGSVAQALLARMPPCLGSLFPTGSAALVASHDIGKCSPGFQLKYFPGELAKIGLRDAYADVGAYEPRHAVVSEASLRAWAKSRSVSDSFGWAEAAGAHHGSRSAPRHEPNPRYGGDEWLALRNNLLETLIREYGNLPSGPPTPEALRSVSGLTTVADWIGSDETWFPPSGLPASADLSEQVEKALDEAGWRWPAVRPGLAFRDLFGEDFRPNDLQLTVHDLAQEPGLIIVEAPTGMGKTEAALWAAYRLMASGHHHGLYFALPTRLTSDRIHRRVARFLRCAFDDTTGARLAHGSAWMAEPCAGGGQLAPGGSWFHPLKRALLEPFGVGTVDQALLAVLCVRHAFVRAFGLAGKVVVLDEVHSYDMYTGTLLVQLVNLLLRMRCSVIITSATLTSGRRAEFLPPDHAQIASTSYPLITASRDTQLITCAPPSPPDRRATCRFSDDDAHAVAKEVVRQAKGGACVLWITNTVARSQRALKAVRAETTEGLPTGLIHSRFPPWRREQLEDEWMDRLGPQGQRPSGCVLVSTQVAEQSVDIDADLLVTDLAPTDMLIQRMGRLWRHPRCHRPLSRPETWVVTQDLDKVDSVDELSDRLGPSRCVYAAYVLWKSYQVWHRMDEVLLPNQVRDLLEETYRDPGPSDPPWIEGLFREMKERQDKLRHRAEALSDQDLPELNDHEEVATRYNSRKMVDVLLVRTCDITGDRVDMTLADKSTARLDKWRRDWAAARDVHRNLVSLPRFPDFRCAQRPAWLEKSLHDPHATVLRVTENGLLTNVHGRKTRYAYDDQLGVCRLDEKDMTFWDDRLEEDPPDGSDW